MASSGLSIQYAIAMGLIDYANETFPGKAIKFIVPPNCYGGTNDQARRVAACIDNVEVMDLPVDGDHDMVQSTDSQHSIQLIMLLLLHPLFHLIQQVSQYSPII